MRIVWMITLCFFISGCAGYQPASLPGFELPNENDEWGSYVEIGTMVRLIEHSGKTVSGEVVRISDDFLILEFSDGNGLEEYEIGFDQVASLEAKTEPNKPLLVLAGTVLVVVVVSIVVALTMDNVDEVTSPNLGK